MDQSNPQAVNLTDTISPWWYVSACLLPIVGFIAGIVFMAKSKIGPAIALWATCFIAVMVWSTVLYTYDATNTGDDDIAYLECVTNAASLEAMELCESK